MLFSTAYCKAEISDGWIGWFDRELVTLGCIPTVPRQAPFGQSHAELTYKNSDSSAKIEISDKRGVYYVQYILNSGKVYDAETSAPGQVLDFIKRMQANIKFNPDEVREIKGIIIAALGGYGLEIFPLEYEVTEVDPRKRTTYKFKYTHFLLGTLVGTQSTYNIEISVTTWSDGLWTVYISDGTTKHRSNAVEKFWQLTSYIGHAMLSLVKRIGEPAGEHKPLADKNQQAMLSLVNKVKQKGQVSKQEMERFFKEYAV